MPSYIPKSKNQEHITPDKIYNMICEISQIHKEQLYDPVPAGTPYKAPCFFNGLYGNWQEWNYLNPPYEVKTLTKFVDKAIEQASHGFKTWLLLPAKTDQDWFHMIIQRGYEIHWIRNRLRFKNNKWRATQSHFLVLIK